MPRRGKEFFDAVLFCLLRSATGSYTSGVLLVRWLAACLAARLPGCLVARLTCPPTRPPSPSPGPAFPLPCPLHLSSAEDALRALHALHALP